MASDMQGDALAVVLAMVLAAGAGTLIVVLICHYIKRHRL